MTRAGLGLIGYGEIGSAVACQVATTLRTPVRVFSRRLASLGASERQHWERESGQLRIASSLAELLAEGEVVISAVTPAAAGMVAEEAARRWRQGLFIDVNSISPAEKVRLAGHFPSEAYVDGSILGSFAGKGVETPIALSGPLAQQAHVWLSAAGFCTSVIGSEVGIAATLKMCRSIFMKGLEALFVETSLAGLSYQLSGPLFETIEQTFRSYTIRELSTMLLTTHAVHAGRRAEEMEQVLRALRERALPVGMTQATRDCLAETHRLGLASLFGQQVPRDADEVVRALEERRRGETAGDETESA